MSLQYISDAKGRHTAVIISIDDWNALKAKHKDLEESLEAVEKPKQKPSDFRGAISKETAEKMIADLEQSRNEWERRI